MFSLLSKGRTAARRSPSAPITDSIKPPVAQAELSAQEARPLILAGRAPNGLVVKGNLNLRGEKGLSHLPDNLHCQSLDISDCPNLYALPEGLQCNDLIAQNLKITYLPQVQVKFRLDLSGCTSLEELPGNLKAGSLVLRDCTGLKQLPEGLDVYFLDISGCILLEHFPQHGSIQVGHLVARGCHRLRELPTWLDKIAQLDLSGCLNISQIPAHLHISSWLDLADSGIQSLPKGKQIPLRWKGVPIDERIAFRPETISGQEVLQARNVELRRVLLERMGHERFITEVGGLVLDKDHDTGGERKLVRVPFEGDEPLVVLWVICPSTGRNYVLRVPPHISRCRQAAAWIAGFDHPGEYNPVIET